MVALSRYTYTRASHKHMHHKHMHHKHMHHKHMHHKHITLNTTQPVYAPQLCARTSATRARHMRSRTPQALARTFVRAELMTWVKYGW
jgi:hypothetical protein